MAETEIDEQQIRERAYQLWMDAGCPDGRDEEFWHLAMQEARLGADPASPVVPDPAPSGGLA